MITKVSYLITVHLDVASCHLVDIKSALLMVRVHNEDIQVRNESEISKASLTLAPHYPKHAHPCGGSLMIHKVQTQNLISRKIQFNGKM